MESITASPLRPAPVRRVLGVLAAVALALYAVMLIRNVSACAGGADSSGYMNHARLLGLGRLHTPPRELPGLDAAHFSDFLYTPLGFVPQDGLLVPSYPVGMPLMIMAAHWLAGWTYAGDVVIVFHSLAALVLLFALGRALGLSERACLLATGALAASPLFIAYSLQAMTDVPALAWTTATALTLWLARRRERWAGAAGLVFGISVLVRPNNVLMLAPAVVVWWPEAWTGAELKRWGRLIVSFGLGGLPTAAGFALHSHAAYGHWLTTGYGDASSLFQRAMVPLTLRHYAQWMPVVFSAGVGLFLLLPLVRRSRGSLFLLTWGLAYLAFYVSYYHTHEAWWNLRFILPAAPAFILGAIWAARELCRLAARWMPYPAAAWILYGLAAAGVLRAELKWDRRFQVLAVGHGEANYPAVIAWLRQHVPANSVLEVMQASGAAFYYSDFIALRWDQMSARTFPEVTAAAAREGRAIYAPLFPFETESALKERMPGQWEPVAQLREVVIYRWAGAAPQ